MSVDGNASVVARADTPASDSAEGLMEAYVRGDAVSFEALYLLVSPRMLGFLMRLTRNRERAEDLMQVTFTKIHRARASYLPGAPFLPWALAIARRSFYDEVRSAKSRKEELSFDGQLPEPQQPLTGDATQSDLAEALERALNQLPEAYRESIQLTKVTGLSVAEAASVIGTTPTAVKLRVHRGYKALRTAMETQAREHGISLSKEQNDG